MVPHTLMNNALIVEDQPALAAWLHETLDVCFPGIAVTIASSRVEALRQLAAATPEQAPQLALVDLGLPDGNGVDVIRALALLENPCHIVVTTIYADDQHLFPALKAGAQGYLLKDQPRDKTVQALRGIASGEPPLSASIARRLLRVFSDPSHESAQSLSPRERETLSLIARGFRIGEVATTLGVSHHTAHEYVKNVYRKLKISSRAEATLEATRLGLVNPHL